MKRPRYQPSIRAQDVVGRNDEIQHQPVLLNFRYADPLDTRSLERFRLPQEKPPHWISIPKPLQDIHRLLKQHQTVIDFTLTTFVSSSNVMAICVAGLRHRFPEHMPLDVRRGFRVASMNIPDAATARSVIPIV
jgi:hypothetical protein